MSAIRLTAIDPRVKLLLLAAVSTLALVSSRPLTLATPSGPGPAQPATGGA